MFIKIMKDLNKAGITDSQLCELTSLSAATISRLRSGGIVEPKYAAGTVLVAMHEKHCKKTKKMKS